MTQQSHFVRGYASTRGGQIHFAEAGEGPPLLLLSESPRTHRQYRRLIPLLAPHFRVIAPDYPGYGNSDPLPGEISVKGVTEAIVQFLDALKLPKARIFGLHTGNKIGTCLAADWPDRVEKFVLCGHTHSIIPELEARNSAIQPILDTYLTEYDENVDGSHHIRNWAVAYSNVNSYWWTNRILFGQKIDADFVKDAEDRVIDYLLGWRNTVAMYKAVFAYDLAEAYTRVAAPTLVFELLTPQEMHLGEQAQRVASLMRNATTASIDSSYLAAPQEQANEIAETILPFLKGEKL